MHGGQWYDHPGGQLGVRGEDVGFAFCQLGGP